MARFFGLELRAQASVGGVHAKQPQDPLGLPLRFDTEAEERADQVLELIDVRERLRREDRRGVLTAAEAVDPLDE